jgi:hypothetical protein
LVRIPLTATKRSQHTYAKLLSRVDPRSCSAFAWQGRFLRPGSTVPEAELWPDGTFPRVPLVVEFCGALKPAKGWNRHQSDETAVLWAYEKAQGEFLEIGRVAAPTGLWMRSLEPLVRDAMARELGELNQPDLEVIRTRITRVLAAELDLVAAADRSRLLTLVHDELAWRIVEWGDYPTTSGETRVPV